MADMITAIPKHLNADFFKEALDPYGKKKLVLKDLKVVQNTTGGNYSSDIYRATVKYVTEDDNQEKSVHLVIKALFESMSESSCEHSMYKDILPALNGLLAEAGIERPALSPKVYFSRKTTAEIHVFDDMNKLGYKDFDRFVGYNAAQSKKVLEKLAHFHASSMVLKRKHPESLLKLAKYFWVDNPQFSQFISTVIDENTKHAAKIVSQWPGYESIANKMLQNTGEVFQRKFLDIFKPNATKLRAIVHGDLWIKNILMLESSEKTILDAVFVDYQICFHGSPAIDINNFLMTSVTLDVLRTEYDNLIEYYHSVLCDTLKKFNSVSLNIELPTLDDLHEDILQTEYLTYYDLIFAFPQTNLSEELSKDMDYGNFFEPERLIRNRQDMFSNQRVLDMYRFELKRLDNLGILD